MQLTLIFGDSATASIDISANEEIQILQQLVLIEFQIPIEEQVLYHNDRIIPLTGTLGAFGIQPDDIIIVSRQQPTQSQSSSASSGMRLHQLPSNVSPEQLLQFIDNHPNLLEEIRANDAELAPLVVLQPKDKAISEIRKLFMKRMLNAHKKEFQQQQELNLLAANPDTEEHQRLIEQKVISPPCVVSL